MKKLLLLLVLSFTFTSMAQWELRYPPQLTTGINSMYFIDQQTGFAVNYSGSILKTIDGGEHWEILKYFRRNSLDGIIFTDDLHGYIYSPHSFIGDDKDFVYTTDGGNSWEATWIGLSYSYAFYPLNNSEILRSDEQGAILKLDNFFGLWSEKFRTLQYIGGDVPTPYGVILQFEELKSGRIAALGSSWNAFNAGVIGDSVSFILYSDDKGNSWDSLWSGLTNTATCLSFADDSTGWMGFENNNIYKTTDGGLSWQLAYTGDSALSGKISKIVTLDQSKMYAVSSRGQVISTTDGGLSFSSIDVGPSSNFDSFYNIYFVNEQKGFVFGPDLWVTTNGGNDWTIVDNSVKPDFDRIQFLNTSTGYGLSSSSLYKTNDGGYSWSELYKPENYCEGFYMYDSLNGWVVDFNKLLKTTDGGKEWEEVYVDSLLDFMRGIVFYSKEFGILYEVRQRFNNNSLIYVTTDGGETWNKNIFGGPHYSSYRKIIRTDPTHIWIANEQGLWLSRDSVKTWTNISTEVSGLDAAYDFLDSLNGCVAHLDSRQDKIKITSDGGNTWKTIMKPYMIQSTDMVIDGRDYFGRLNTTVSGLYGNILGHSEDDDYLRDETGPTNAWLHSISVYREGNKIHKWIGGRGGTILYRGNYITGVDETDPAVWDNYSLSQNYPNPFNPNTIIRYQIPQSGFVTLKIFDILGKEVTTLVSEEKNAGRYEVNFNASNLSSGVYVYKLQSGDFMESRKMILMK